MANRLMNVGAEILGVGVSVGGCAAAAVVLGNPIGAAGGAIFGVSHGVVGACVRRLVGDENGLVAKTAQLAAPMLGGWKLAALFGVNMTLKSVVILNVTSLVFVTVGIGIAILVSLVSADKSSKC